MGFRGVVAVGALGVTTVAAFLAPQPAGADAEAGLYNIVGNFYGDDRDEVFQYRQEAGADYMLEFEKDGGDIYATTYTREVGAAFHPFTGDFDGDGYDEIYWNRAPTGQDYIMNVLDPTSDVSTPVVKDGLHFVTAGDFTGDGADDILWYGPGAGADQIWEFDVGGTYTQHALTLAGDARPYAGNYKPGGGDEVVWYGPGAQPDTMWTFAPGTLTPTSTPVNPIAGTAFQAFALDTKDDGYDDIFWYAPGSDQEWLWDYTATGVTMTATANLGASYHGAAGDLFGDGHDDMLLQGTLTTIWDWHPNGSGGTGLTYHSFGVGLQAVAPADRRRAPSGPVLVAEASGPPS